MTRSAVRTHRATPGLRTGHTFYELEIAYTYSVDGQRYTGRRYGLGSTTSSDRAILQRLADTYVPGMAVTVWYDPGQPAESVLVQRTGTANWQYLFLGLVMVLFAIAIPMLWVDPE